MEFSKNLIWRGPKQVSKAPFTIVFRHVALRVCVNAIFAESATFRSAPQLIAKNASGIESLTARVFVFSALSSFHVFSRVVWPTHGNSHARFAMEIVGEGIYMREFYRAAPAFGFDAVLFLLFSPFFGLSSRFHISFRKKIVDTTIVCGLLAKILCSSIWTAADFWYKIQK